MPNANSLQATHYLDDLNGSLNAEQRLAAETTEGPVIVVAGAGAGKTKALIHRVATLMRKGIPPANMLVVTFTNRAAEEIKHRLAGMVGENAHHVVAGTFHSVIFRHILKKYPDSNFLKEQGIDMRECTIMDEDESKKIMKETFAGLDDQTASHLEEISVGLDDIRHIMSMQRAKGRDVRDFLSNIQPGASNQVLLEVVGSFWRAYSEKCRQFKGIDFDDILVYADKMLRREPAIAKELSEQFKYLMLDEYQDTNRVQMNIMDSIARSHQNICVVGDEKQSIYGFRGADISVILSFKQRYPNATQIDMAKNYRSNPSVIKFANACASSMRQRLSDGRLQAMSQHQSMMPRIVEFENSEIEAEMICRAIRRDLSQGTMGKEIAVLYRNKHLKNLTEKKLVEMDVPYQLVGDTSFYDRAEVKDCVAMMRFIFRPWDSIAAARFLRAARIGVSDEAIKSGMEIDGLNVHEILKRKSRETLRAQKKGQEPQLTSTAKKVLPFVELAQELRAAVLDGESPEFVQETLAAIWDIYLLPRVRQLAARGSQDEREKELEARIENAHFIINRLGRSLSNGLTVDEVLEDLVLMIESNSVGDRNKDGKVCLLTIHASKGLEFDNVYLIGMDHVSMAVSEDDDNDTEEERRIAYVALTRAKKRLSLSFSTWRRQHGMPIQVGPSEFLLEIERGLNIERKHYPEAAPSALSR